MMMCKHGLSVYECSECFRESMQKIARQAECEHDFRHHLPSYSMRCLKCGASKIAPYPPIPRTD